MPLMLSSIFIDFLLIILLVKEASHRENHAIVFLIYVISTAFMITIFSFIYSNVGVYLKDGSLAEKPLTFAYFSVVTWTSLGYGDIYPSEEARIWVMMEVFFGYFHMGILVGFILDYINSKNNKHRKGLDLQKNTLYPLEKGGYVVVRPDKHSKY